MNKYLSNKKLIGILISVIAIAALIALSVNRTKNVNPVQQGVNDITSLASQVITAPVNAVSNTFEAVDNLMHTYDENKHLKSRIQKTEELQAQLDAVEAEQKALEDELQLSHSLSEYEKIHGTVISRNPDGWIDQLVVDRGSENGVEIGMAVMSQNGLVGRVTEVSPLSAKVTLMTTANQRDNLVSAEIHVEQAGSDQTVDEQEEDHNEKESTEEIVHGVVEGYDQNTKRLIMEQITSNADLHEGQVVYTSGLSNQTPRSLIIGTIDEVTSGDFGLTQRVYITPAADFDDIRYVTIVKRLAEKAPEDMEASVQNEDQPEQDDQDVEESGTANGED